MRKRVQAPPISEATKRSWKRSRLDFSAGGVAYQTLADGTHEAALIATRGGTRWQLPKGSREPGESSLATAMREVEEEVGLATEYVAFLDTIDFWYWDTYRKEVPELVHKRVDFYLLRVIGGEISDASHEVDGAAWFPVLQAVEVLTFEGERHVVRLAMRTLDASAAEQPGAPTIPPTPADNAA